MEELAKELNSKFPNTQTLVVAGDASSNADNQKAVEETVAKFGGITGAFINAGIFRAAPLVDMTDEDLDSLLNV